MKKSQEPKWYVSSDHSEKIEFRSTKKEILKQADKMLTQYNVVTIGRWH